MLRKIILPVVLLLFTQQDFYGMKGENDDGEEKAQVSILETINNLVNIDYTKKEKNKYPKLWFLWTFLDNIPFQYGNSEIWKHGEAYYGLSNGIGFFPSILNFGWIKIGIIDAHINVINLILHYFKCFIKDKTKNTSEILPFLLFPILIHSSFNIHIFSIKILKRIKIKLLAPLTLLVISFIMSDNDENSMVGGITDKGKGSWYITYNNDGQISWWYALLSPRIEINIPEIINYFKCK